MTRAQAMEALQRLARARVAEDETCWSCDFARATTDVGLCWDCHAGLTAAT